jgi:putative aminopeptidase FrvX
MLLKRLSEAHGVSGREEDVRSIILEEIRDRVDAARVDAMGNLIARKKGTGESPLRVLLAAHMDEVGLMITQVEDSGLLRFAKVGGIDDRVLPARTVLIGDHRVPGVIGVKPVHLTEKSERDQVTGWKLLAIDIGASSRGEAEKLVQRGDRAVFATEFRELADSRSAWRTVQGKAFDDRAGCAILAELLRGRFPFELSAAFTVQEEVGLRGARVAAFAENPEAAVVLECTAANEVPTKRDVSPSTRLGAGPAITIRDNSFIADPRLVELFAGTARDLGIPHQFKQPNIGGTDAGVIHRARAGVPSVTIAVPARYIHSPAAIMDLNDFEAAITLTREALQRLPAAVAGARRTV